MNLLGGTPVSTGLPTGLPTGLYTGLSRAFHGP